MKVLVLGASGATGRLVVRQLMKRRIETRILVRENAILPEGAAESPFVEVVRGGIAELEPRATAGLLEGCDAVVSCLGHNITFKGMFGKPRSFVYEALKRVVETAERRPGGPLKLLLMSTIAYTNTGAGERNFPRERPIFALLKLLLPPHLDNMMAGDYLNKEVGRGREGIEWVAVRPDGLIDEDAESAYTVHGSPIRSPLFDAGKTSRMNVSRFMAELLVDEGLWREWKFKMPVIYNEGFGKPPLT